MKFNKAKLAALAMSAFMGTALFGFSAFAGEALPEHESTAASQETTAAVEIPEVTITGVTFTSDGKVTVTFSDGSEKKDSAKVDEQKAATCEEPGYIRYSYQIPGETGPRYSEKYELAALGHKVSSSPKTEVVKEARHTIDGDNTGVSYTGYYCVREHKDANGNPYTVWMTKDGKTESTDPEAILAIPGSGMTKAAVEVVHDWVQVGKPVIIDTEYAELDANDQPVLKQKDIGARYDIQYFCQNGGEYAWYHELYGDYAYLKPEISYSEVYNVAYKNIKGYYFAENRALTSWLPSNPDPAQIVLLDCEKPGYYVEIYRAVYGNPYPGAPANVITTDYLYTTREGVQIDAQSLVFDEEGHVTAIKGDATYGIVGANTKTVDPHHVYSGKIQVVKKDDNVSYTFTEAIDNKTGYGFNAYNNSCKYEAKYTIKKECLGGCKNMDMSKEFVWVLEPEVKLAPNPNAHKIPEGYNKDAIDLAVKNMKAGRTADWSAVKGYGKNHDGVGYPSSVEEIERLLENITATCTTTGTGEMVWYCTVCGARVKVETVPVAALGHKIGEKRENIVEATCGTDGSYDAVQYCVRCGEEYSREKVVIPATGDHKFGDDFIVWYGKDVVDYNGRLMTASKKDYRNPQNGLSAVGTFAGLNAHYNQDYVVYANVEHTCTVCGQQHVKDYRIHLDIVGDVVKSNKDGYPGSITLRAYAVADNNLNKVLIEDTKTFNYYTSMDEYTARVVEPPVEPEKPKDDPKEDDPKPAEPEQKLPAVEGLKAANAGINKIQVTWNAVEGADGYLVLKNGIQVGYTTGATSYLDRNASAEDFSYYWVIPYKKTASGNAKGELSNYVWAIGRVVAPVAELKAEAAKGGVNLTWIAADGANAYVILSKTDSNKAAFNAPVEVTGTSYTAKAEAGKVQFYWVYAIYNNAEGRRVVAGKVSPFAWAIAE